MKTIIKDYFDGVKGRDNKISLESCGRPSPNEGWEKMIEAPRNSRHMNFKCPAKIWTCTDNSPNSSKNDNWIYHSLNECFSTSAITKSPSVLEIKIINDIALYWNYFTDMKTGRWNSPMCKATPEVCKPWHPFTYTESLQSWKDG